jgi:hypothetical protein
MRILFITLIFVASSLPMFAQVSGTVFRDFNANGVKDNTATFNEIGMAGTVVTAYNAAGAAIASYTCTATGTYSMPASGTAYDGMMGSNTGFVAAATAVRLEFTSIPTLYYATMGGTSVRFVTAPATLIDFGINYPNDYA